MTTRTLLVLAALLLFGPLEAGDASAKAPKYKGQAVTDGSTIRGGVRTTQKTRSQPLLVDYDTTVCGTSVPDDSVLADDGRLAGVVIYLEDISHGLPAKPAQVTLDQIDCRFVPRVLTATVGSHLVVLNSDAILHNVHAIRDKKSTIFNIAMPDKGDRQVKKLKRSGHHTMQCDAGHHWMHAHVHVFPHPYHTVSRKDGSYELKDVPPGEWKVTVWHEVLGTVSKTVTVPASGEVEANFVL